MHIPDGFLDAKTAAVTAALAAGGLGMALRRTRLGLPPRQIPLLGLAAAFVFAAQMLNFPVAGGTSGHLIGATLTAVLLGPSAAVVVISCVLIVQCFLFADGGVTALGANIFNMAMIGAVCGWCIYFIISSMLNSLFGRIVAATFAAWSSTVAASIFCTGELAFSNTVRWNLAFPAMAGIHMIIGIAEGVITALVLSGVAANRPELLQNNRASHSYASLIAYGLIISAGMALFVAPFASTAPDGLDKTAQQLDFESYAKPLINSPLPNLGTSIAGIIGVAAALGLSLMLARMVVPKPALLGNPKASASPQS